jgi:ABC-2 type transport system permease protein
VTAVVDAQPARDGRRGQPEPSLIEAWRRWIRAERRRDTGGGPVARIGQIYRRREVLVELIIGGLKSSYGNTFAGLGSVLIQPGSLIFIYFIVFGHVAKLGITHYPLFIAAGMLPWYFFNNAVGNSLNALRGNSGIIRTINMPREIFPLARVGQGLVEFFISLPLVIGLALLFGVPPSRYLFVFPIAVAIELVLCTGLALMLSALSTIVRDVSRLWRPSHRVWFYLSPVVYPLSRVHGGALLFLYKLNPLVGIIELNRLIWYPHYLITPTAVFHHAMMSAVSSTLILIAGWWTFMRIEPLALKEL